MSSTGSGLMTKQGPAIPHLSTGEVADLRSDVAKQLRHLAALVVEEYTNPVAADAAGLRAATAPALSVQTLTAADLLAGGKTALAADGRNVTFTTAGATPADAPDNATVTGTDMDGNEQTEVIAVPQTATISAGAKIFKTIKSIEFEAGEGAADCTVSIGFGVLLGLSKPIKTRAGRAAVVQEIAAGSVVTTGTLSAANRSYSPAAAPDGSRDYCLYYETDSTV